MVLQIHTWLHAVDHLECSGPGPCFWCWVCERMCGHYARAITSRKHPYASLNRRALEEQTLAVIINKYDLQDALPVYTRMSAGKNLPTFTDPEYPEVTLLHPRRILSFKKDKLGSLQTRIAARWATMLGLRTRNVKKYLPYTFEQWSRIQMADGGDYIVSSLGAPSEDDTRRDCSFIQYELHVDSLAHRRRAKPKFVKRTFFGKVERIIVINIPARPEIGQQKEDTMILLDVHVCRTTEDCYGFHEYTNLGYHEIVDASCLRASVGRIRDRGKWVIVKREGNIETMDFAPEEDG